jgi:hypothetical protein
MVKKYSTEVYFLLTALMEISPFHINSRFPERTSPLSGENITPFRREHHPFPERTSPLSGENPWQEVYAVIYPYSLVYLLELLS